MDFDDFLNELESTVGKSSQINNEIARSQPIVSTNDESTPFSIEEHEKELNSLFDSFLPTNTSDSSYKLTKDTNIDVSANTMKQDNDNEGSPMGIAKTGKVFDSGSTGDIMDIFQGIIKPSKDIEDSKVIPIKQEIPNTLSQSSIEPVSSTTTSSDFLAWLDNSTTPNISNENVISNNQYTPSLQLTKGDNLDSLFATSKPLHTLQPSEYANEYSIILNSSSPDIFRLRELILISGGIPNELRCKVWNLIFKNDDIEDKEAIDFHFDMEIESSRNFIAMISDCFNIQDKDDEIHSESLKRDAMDLISLFCIRKFSDYTPLYFNLFVPLIVTSHKVANRSLLMSTFTNFMDHFVVFSSLKAAAIEITQEVLHSWLHLLLEYHSPLLCQHLDRVIPEWYLPSRAIPSPDQVKQSYSVLSNNSKIGQLDRDLGLDTLDQQFGWTVTAAPSTESNQRPVVDDASSKTWSRNPGSSKSNTIDSSIHSSDKTHTGLISTQLIMSNIIQLLPAKYSLRIYDWAIAIDEKYAGIFLVLALLEFYSSALLSMNSLQLESWFIILTHLASTSPLEETNTWFTLISSPTLQQSYKLNSDDENTLSWDAFICGLVHIATSLRHKTPTGFQISLSETEAWAHATIVDMSLSGFDQDVPLSSLGTSMTTQFQLYRSRLQEHGIADARVKMNRKIWTQDKYVDNENLCIWSSPAEVIPCLLSSPKREISSIESLDYFTNSLKFREEGKLSFPLSMQFSSETPFFYGIDCRNDQEKKLLGSFAKTYHLDGSNLSDSDEVVKLLEILEPLASSAHLCLIGAGDAYHQWYHSTYQQGVTTSTSSSSSDGQQKKGLASWSTLLVSNSRADINKSILEAIKTEKSTLNSIALFFHKKSFKHVSILDGGFVGAARYLNNVNSSGLSTHILDININNVLGILSSTTDIYVPPVASLLTSSSSSTAANVSNKILSVTGSLLSTLSTINTSNFLFTEDTTQTSDSVVTEQHENNQTPTTTSSLPTTNSMFSGFTKKLGMFGVSSMETIKKSLATSVPSSSEPVSGLMHVNSNSNTNIIDKSTAFVIDDEDDEDEDADTTSQDVLDGMNSDKINVKKTDVERQQALVLHKLAGLKKLDTISITKEYLPGAILFPCYKIKEIDVVTSKSEPIKEQDLLVSEEGEKKAIVMQDNEIANTKEIPKVENITKRVIQVHRYLVVTKERFMVIDSKGGGVGSTAIVKSNHHLTELIKMTFRKKDPDLVSLYFLHNGEANKVHQYRLTKRQEFVTTLQSNMQKFK